MAVGVTFPRGFRAAGVAAGIKASGRPDIAIVAANETVSAAAVFTRSATAAAPVTLSQRHIAQRRARAVVISSGNANAATGPQGMRDAEQMATRVAAQLGVPVTEVLVASTGVIGVPLPMPRVMAGIDAALAALSPEGGAAAAEAITTTDAAPKLAARELTIPGAVIRVGGMAKGAGMIRPDLGTMIAVVTTDATLTPEQAARILQRAVDKSFNCITVDGCTSTSDTVVLLASGVIADELTDADEAALAEVVSDLCLDLALQIVRDGEGAHRIARWQIIGATDDATAKAIAYAVAEAQLVRCALNGGDPNWGRIIAALGVTGYPVEADRIGITLGGHVLCRGGVAVPLVDVDAVNQAAALDTVEITIDLGLGQGTAVIWASDLSNRYVELNAEYTT